jgi:hypothetical protein
LEVMTTCHVGLHQMYSCGLAMSFIITNCLILDARNEPSSIIVMLHP